MYGFGPACAEGLLAGETGVGLPAAAGVEDEALGVCGPGYLRVEFDGVAVVVFALGQSLFGLFAKTDVYHRNGDADDFVGLVARGLIGDKVGTSLAGVAGVGETKFKAGDRLAVEGALEVWFTLGEFFWEDVNEVSTEVGGYREIMHFSQAFIDADISEVVVEKAEADGDTVVDCVELGESLRGQGFEAKREIGVGC